LGLTERVAIGDGPGIGEIRVPFNPSSETAACCLLRSSA
jgi:hypothetical protein